MSDCPCNLNGLHVLITRPGNQADMLVASIRSCHGNPTHLPLLEIAAEPEVSIKAELGKANTVDDLVFISPNAVTFSAPYLRISSQRVIAIGKATAATLAQHQITADIIPDTPTSEGLLNSGELGDMDKRRVLIVRGVGGRELLADELRTQRAIVDYAEVYSRRCPTLSSEKLVDALQPEKQAIISTSNQITDNLLEVGNSDSLILSTPLVVISERMHKYAISLGFKTALLARSAAEIDVLTALCEFVHSG